MTKTLEHFVATEDYREGKARLTLPIQHGIRLAFYNPKMSLNRDLAMLFTRSHFQSSRAIRLADPMTGSGVRAARYVLECPNLDSVIAADSDSQSLLVARQTIRLNGLEGRITLVESDANRLLLDHSGDRFDLIDLDPFGSPSPFFECALRATVDQGVIAATATDMAPLTGARKLACLRKYGITPVRTEFEKEMAVRILSGNLALTAGKLELGIEIVFSHASDHYVRIYAGIRKGKAQANRSTALLGYVEYCPKCLMRTSKKSLGDIRNSCDNCGTRTEIGGPLWLGRLWDSFTVRDMVDQTPSLVSSRLSEVQNVLSSINEEQNASAFHYRTDSISKAFSTKPPALSRLLAELRESGYQASRTHFHPVGFRTNARIDELRSVLGALEIESK